MSYLEEAYRMDLLQQNHKIEQLQAEVARLRELLTEVDNSRYGYKGRGYAEVYMSTKLMADINKALEGE